MLIEAHEPIRATFKTGSISLLPGKPMELPDHDAQKLLERAGDKVRALPSTQRDWLASWRYVAALSAGLLATDPRLSAVMHAIEHCDEGFRQDSWHDFDEGVLHLQEALQGNVLTAGERRQPVSHPKNR